MMLTGPGEVLMDQTQRLGKQRRRLCKSNGTSAKYEGIYVFQKTQMNREYDEKRESVIRGSSVLTTSWIDPIWTWSCSLWGTFQDNHLLTVSPRKIMPHHKWLAPESQMGAFRQVQWWEPRCQ